MFEEFRREQEELKKEVARILDIKPIPFDEENGELIEEPAEDLDSLLKKVAETKLQMQAYKKRCKLLAAVRKRSDKAARRCAKNLWTGVPLSVYERLKEETVPLMKALLKDTPDDFGVAHLLRHLAYFALKHPGKLKGVTFEDLKEDE